MKSCALDRSVHCPIRGSVDLGISYLAVAAPKLTYLSSGLASPYASSKGLCAAGKLLQRVRLQNEAARSTWNANAIHR